jgi:hypothetical protein
LRYFELARNISGPEAAWITWVMDDRPTVQIVSPIRADPLLTQGIILFVILLPDR